MWLKASDCAQVVGDLWGLDKDLLANLDACRFGLARWNKETFGSVKDKIKQYKTELEDLSKLPFTADRKQQENSIRKALERELDREEIIWQQRAKTQWLAEGDRNTRFFHSQAIRRAHINQIVGLQNESGLWCTEMTDMAGIINQYFREIFTSRKPSDTDIEDVVGVLGSRVNQAINRELCRVFTPNEIKRALFDMYPLKSPGPDGIPAPFYQRFWTLVGSNVTDCALQFLNQHILNPTLNYRHIVLIPKCKSPKKITQFRPISLSNVMFKIASKAFTNRLKPHMNAIISETQSAFIPNRLITDNVLVSYEVNHFIKQKKRQN